jgi:hypothetical protein
MCPDACFDSQSTIYSHIAVIPRHYTGVVQHQKNKDGEICSSETKKDSKNVMITDGDGDGEIGQGTLQ